MIDNEKITKLQKVSKFLREQGFQRVKLIGANAPPIALITFEFSWDEETLEYCFSHQIIKDNE